MKRLFILLMVLVSPVASSASNLRLALSSDGMATGGLALQWALSGLTGDFYACEVATNGTTFFTSNVTASAYWNITVGLNQTWKFRLETITGGVGQGDFSPTNSVYGDSKPENVSVSSSSTTQILLAFKNLSAYETGFLAEEATNSAFTNSTFYNLPPTPRGPYSTNWSHTLAFAPDTTYYYRVYATNNAYSTTNGNWGLGYGGTGSDVARATVVDASGNIFVAGTFSGTFNFGGTVLTSAGGLDVFISKFNSAGTLQWVKGYGATGTEVVTCLTLDPSGNVIIGGNFSGTANFGGTNMPAVGQQDIFVAKYDSGGNFVWEKGFGSTLDDVANGVATDSSGNVILTGYFEDNINFGGGTIFATFGGPDSFLLKLTPASAYVWNKTFVSFADDRGIAVQVDSGDNPILAGYFLGTQIDLGTGPLFNAGSSDGYLGKWNSAGTILWSTNYGGTSTDQNTGIKLDASGNAYVIGFFTGAATIAGVPLITAGGWDTFLAKFSPSGGGLWARSFPSPGNFDLPSGLGTDTNGNVAIVGHFTSTINLGGGIRTAPILGTQTIFSSKYTSAGTYLWDQIMGSTGSDFGSGAAVDYLGNTTFVGSFGGTGTNFGGQTLTSAGSDDIFVAQFSLGSNTTVNAGITLPSTSVSIAPNQTPPPALLLVSRTTDTANQIVNSWVSGGGSINNWILQESVGSLNNFHTVSAPVDDPVNGMSFTTNGITSGTVTYWRVYATNGAGSSTILTNRVDMPIPGVATGGNWYIDISARTNGSNLAGTNWASAWPAPSSANWSLVSSGVASPQTIWLAQGNYNEYALCMTPGSGALVTLHAATNSPQKGMASFLELDPYRNRFVINGAADDHFVSTVGPYPALFNDTNNMNISMASINGALARGIYSPTDSTSNQIFWCRIGPVGIWHNALGESDQGGIGMINTTSGGTEIAHCYLSDIFGTGITINGGQETYGTTYIHHNIIDRVHCNYIVTGYGADVVNNYLLGVAQFQVGHPDGYQPAAGWTRFCNNYVKDVPNGRLFYPEMFRTNNDPNIMVTGNLFWFDSLEPAEAIDFTTEPLAYNGGSVAWPSMTFSNILVANNTMVNLGTSINARRSDVTNLFLKSTWFLNNIISGDGAFSLLNIGAPADAVNYISPTYDSTQVIVDNNLIQNGLVRYNTNVTTVAGLPFTHNSTGNPGFVNKSDFHMTTTLAGTNLTTWLTQCPFLATDMEGVARTTWQVGAYESTGASANTNDAAFVLWHHTPASASGIHDDSFNHATTQMQDVYHWFTNSAGPTASVPNAYSAFSFHSTDAAFFGEGQYGGVSYTNNIDGMTNGTVAFWAKGFVSPDGTLGSVQNAVWMSTGAENDNEIVGSWYFGRHGTANTVLIVQTNNSANHPIILSFPDTTTDGSTAWNHYAWTFNGTNFLGYFNGAAFQTNTPPRVTKLRVGGFYASISGWPHNGTVNWNTPGSQLGTNDHSRLDDGYPNAGFMNGSIADMRVYNRALTPAEIATIHNGAGVIDPNITVQPVSQSVGTNTNPTFRVTATGTSPLTYQWFRSGNSIAGATASAYSTPATVCGDSGAQYYVNVTSGAGGPLQSSTAVLTITNCFAPPPFDIVITLQPQPITVNVGQTATWTVNATGTAPLHYAWTFNGVPIFNNNQNSYGRPNCALTDSGNFAQVVITNVTGSISSVPAQLNVNPVVPHSIGKVTNLKVNNALTH